MKIEKEICSDVEKSSKLEWLETNGLGGFASSTVSGINTRRYHALLVAALKPPVERYVLLSKFDETIVIDGASYDLSSNFYPGAIHPQGYQFLTEFQLDPFPIFTYRVGSLEIIKTIFMPHGQNATIIEYKLNSKNGRFCHLEIRPLIAFRDYHSTTHKNGAINGRFENHDGIVSLAPYKGLPTLYLSHDAEQVEPAGYWYSNFEYPIEKERGLDALEDLFQPFVLRFNMTNREKANIIASIDPINVREIPDLKKTEIKRRKIPQSISDEPLIQTLFRAADQFIVARGDQKTVIAGYHWFSDWGRDTMISLPGLTLATGRFDVARSVLLEFSKHVDRGMLPNRFPDAGETPEYNNVDGTLWYFEAIRSYLEYTSDYDFVLQNLYMTLVNIIDWHVRGTRYGIRMDEDALLLAGEPGVQLTWMDAKIGDWVVTPRYGKPVEIQALWYNALRTMQHLAEYALDSDGARVYQKMADKAKESFEPLFWNPSTGCLYDVVSKESSDPAIRPNQIFAVSLKHALVEGKKAKSVVEVVKRELLTPFGLRSLSPNHPLYRGKYEGGPQQRDAIYHQGAVWPWLIGGFWTAYIKLNGSTVEAMEWLKSFSSHLHEAGLGQVSEILDGDPPFTPRGCMAQAWSVAEILRFAKENLPSFPTKRKPIRATRKVTS